MTKTEFITKWSPRIGEKAARLSISSARLIRLGGLLVPVWSVLLVFGHRDIGVLLLALLLIVVDVGVLVGGVILLTVMHRELTQRLGTKVWFLNSPSLRDGPFQSWCRRHGIDPDRGRFACPCCRNRTLPEKPPGTYYICEVCSWEDDPVQFDNPDYRGGANEQSLNEYRAIYDARRT